MEQYVNENSTSFLECRFKDEFGAAVVPLSGWFRIDDMTGLTEEITGSIVVDQTWFIPGESKYVIVIPASANAIIDDTNIWEDRQVTVEWFYPQSLSATAQGTDVFNYRLKNLSKITG